MGAEQVRTIGTLLRRYRRAAGLSQADLAELAGVSARSIGNLERGVPHIPRRDTLELLAGALKLPPLEAARFLDLGPIALATESDETQPRHLLPRLPSFVVGRDCEVSTCMRFLSGGTRLITLVGPGGVGKSCVGLQVAHAVGQSYPDGVLYAPLDTLRDPGLVLYLIAHVAGLSETPAQPLADALIANLQPKRALLVLDNFEHVAAAAPLVSTLLDACPHIQILVTSRIPLHLQNEQEYFIAPLELPEEVLPVSVSLLEGNPSVALFLQQACRYTPEMTLTAGNAPAIIRICRQLDGLPLALELAAPLLKLFSPEALATRLNHRASLLAVGARNTPAHHQTLHGAIGWSYELLSSDEAQLFRQLSVFAGGAPEDAIETMCQASEHGASPPLSCVFALVEASLLQRQERDGEEPRFVMLETIRAYAHERLVAAGEADATARAHALHYLRFVEETAPLLNGPEQMRWLARMERDHGNIRAALQWTLDAPAYEIGLRLAGALRRFWALRGFVSEGRGWITSLLERAASLPEMPSGAAWNDALAGAFYAAGTLAGEQSEYEQAQSYYERSLALWNDLDNRRGMSYSLNGLGEVSREQGDYAHALCTYARSLQLKRELADQAGIFNTLNNMGLVYIDLGRYESAQTCLEECLLLARTIKDTRMIARALGNLGELATRQNQHARAQVLLHESLELRQASGDSGGVANVLGNLGDLAVAQQDICQALDLYRRSLAVYQQIGHQLGMAQALEALGRVFHASGEPIRAAHVLGAATGIRERIRVPFEGGSYNVAAAYADWGDERFMLAWEEGRVMDLARALAGVYESDAPTAPKLKLGASRRGQARA